MKLRELLRRAETRMLEWNKAEKTKRSFDEMFLNELFENSYLLETKEARILTKELSSYLLNEMQNCNDTTFIDYLYEYNSELFEDED